MSRCDFYAIFTYAKSISMNKFISNFILLASLAFTTVSFARETTPVGSADKHKIFVKVGLGALPANLGGQSPVAPYNRSAIEKTINYQVAVQYFAGKNIALSLTGGQYKFADQYDTYLPMDKIPTPLPFYQELGTSYKYSGKTRYIALEGSLTYWRIHKSSISFYGTVGMAVTHTTAATQINGIYPLEPGVFVCGFGNYPLEVDENKLKAQITPIGIRSGGRIGWYAEAGYGYKGLLNAGVFARL